MLEILYFPGRYHVQDCKITKVCIKRNLLIGKLRIVITCVAMTRLIDSSCMHGQWPRLASHIIIIMAVQ